MTLSTKETNAALKKLREEISTSQATLKLMLEKPMAFSMRELMAGRPLLDPHDNVNNIVSASVSLFL